MSKKSNSEKLITISKNSGFNSYINQTNNINKIKNNIRKNNKAEITDKYLQQFTKQSNINITNYKIQIGNLSQETVDFWKITTGENISYETIDASLEKKKSEVNTIKQDIIDKNNLLYGNPQGNIIPNKGLLQENIILKTQIDSLKFNNTEIPVLSFRNVNVDTLRQKLDTNTQLATNEKASLKNLMDKLYGDFVNGKYKNNGLEYKYQQLLKKNNENQIAIDNLNVLITNARLQIEKLKKEKEKLQITNIALNSALINAQNKLNELKEQSQFDNLVSTINEIGYGYNNNLNIFFNKTGIKTKFASSNDNTSGFWSILNFTDKNSNIDIQNLNLNTINDLNNLIWIPQINEIRKRYPDRNLNKIYVEFPSNSKLLIKTYQINNFQTQSLISTHYIPNTTQNINLLKDTNGNGLDSYIKKLPISTNGGYGGLYWFDNVNNKYYGETSKYEYEIICEELDSNYASGEIYTNIYSLKNITIADYNSNSLSSNLFQNKKIPVYNSTIIFTNNYFNKSFTFKIIDYKFNFNLPYGSYNLEIKNDINDGNTLHPIFGYNSYKQENIIIDATNSYSNNSIILNASMNQDWNKIVSQDDYFSSSGEPKFGGKIKANDWPGENLAVHLKQSDFDKWKNTIKQYITWGHVNPFKETLTTNTINLKNLDDWERKFHVYKIDNNGKITNIKSKVLTQSTDKTWIQWKNIIDNNNSRLPSQIEIKYTVISFNTNNYWIPINKSNTWYNITTHNVIVDSTQKSKNALSFDKNYKYYPIDIISLERNDGKSKNYYGLIPENNIPNQISSGTYKLHQLLIHKYNYNDSINLTTQYANDFFYDYKSLELSGNNLNTSIFFKNPTIKNKNVTRFETQRFENDLIKDKTIEFNMGVNIKEVNFSGFAIKSASLINQHYPSQRIINDIDKKLIIQNKIPNITYKNNKIIYINSKPTIKFRYIRARRTRRNYVSVPKTGTSITSSSGKSTSGKSTTTTSTATNPLLNTIPVKSGKGGLTTLSNLNIVVNNKYDSEKQFINFINNMKNQLNLNKKFINKISTINNFFTTNDTNLKKISEIKTVDSFLIDFNQSKTIELSKKKLIFDSIQNNFIGEIDAEKSSSTNFFTLLTSGNTFSASISSLSSLLIKIQNNSKVKIRYRKIFNNPSNKINNLNSIYVGLQNVPTEPMKVKPRNDGFYKNGSYSNSMHFIHSSDVPNTTYELRIDTTQNNLRVNENTIDLLDKNNLYFGVYSNSNNNQIKPLHDIPLINNWFLKKKQGPQNTISYETYPLIYIQGNQSDYIFGEITSSIKSIGYNDKLYVYNGLLRKFYVYDMIKHNWSIETSSTAKGVRDSDLPKARTHFAMCIKNDDIYLLGGKEFKTDNYSYIDKEIVRNGDFEGIFKYNINSKTWKKLIPFTDQNNKQLVFSLNSPTTNSHCHAYFYLNNQIIFNNGDSNMYNIVIQGNNYVFQNTNETIETVNNKFYRTQYNKGDIIRNNIFYNSTNTNITKSDDYYIENVTFDSTNNKFNYLVTSNKYITIINDATIEKNTINIFNESFNVNEDNVTRKSNNNHYLKISNRSVLNKEFSINKNIIPDKYITKDKTTFNKGDDIGYYDSNKGWVKTIINAKNNLTTYTLKKGTTVLENIPYNDNKIQDVNINLNDNIISLITDISFNKKILGNFIFVEGTDDSGSTYRIPLEFKFNGKIKKINNSKNGTVGELLYGIEPSNLNLDNETVIIQTDQDFLENHIYYKKTDNPEKSDYNKYGYWGQGKGPGFLNVKDYSYNQLDIITNYYSHPDSNGKVWTVEEPGASLIRRDTFSIFPRNDYTKYSTIFSPGAKIDRDGSNTTSFRPIAKDDEMWQIKNNIVNNKNNYYFELNSLLDASYKPSDLYDVYIKTSDITYQPFSKDSFKKDDSVVYGSNGSWDVYTIQNKTKEVYYDLQYNNIKNVFYNDRDLADVKLNQIDIDLNDNENLIVNNTNLNIAKYDIIDIENENNYIIKLNSRNLSGNDILKNINLNDYFKNIGESYSFTDNNGKIKRLNITYRDDNIPIQYHADNIVLTQNVNMDENKIISIKNTRNSHIIYNNTILNNSVINNTNINSFILNKFNTNKKNLDSAEKYNFTSIKDDKDNIYIFGGTKLNNNILTFYNDLWKYDIKNKSWTLINPKNNIKPPARSESVGIFYNNKLYIFGGKIEDRTTFSNSLYDDIWEFDITKTEWKNLTNEIKKNITDSIFPASRFNSIASLVNNNVFIISGETDINSKNNSKEMWVYNIDNDTVSVNGKIEFLSVDYYQEKDSTIKNIDIKNNTTTANGAITSNIDNISYNYKHDMVNNRIVKKNNAILSNKPEKFKWFSAEGWLTFVNYLKILKPTILITTAISPQKISILKNDIDNDILNISGLNYSEIIKTDPNDSTRYLIDKDKDYYDYKFRNLVYYFVEKFKLLTDWESKHEFYSDYFEEITYDIEQYYFDQTFAAKITRIINFKLYKPEGINNIINVNNFSIIMNENQLINNYNPTFERLFYKLIDTSNIKGKIITKDKEITFIPTLDESGNFIGSGTETFTYTIVGILYRDIETIEIESDVKTITLNYTTEDEQIIGWPKHIQAFDDNNTIIPLKTDIQAYFMKTIVNIDVYKYRWKSPIEKWDECRIEFSLQNFDTKQNKYVIFKFGNTSFFYKNMNGVVTGITKVIIEYKKQITINDNGSNIITSQNTDLGGLLIFPNDSNSYLLNNNQAKLTNFILYPYKDINKTVYKLDKLEHVISNQDHKKGEVRYVSLYPIIHVNFSTLQKNQSKIKFLCNDFHKNKQMQVILKEKENDYNLNYQKINTQKLNVNLFDLELSPSINYNEIKLNHIILIKTIGTIDYLSNSIPDDGILWRYYNKSLKLFEFDKIKSIKMFKNSVDKTSEIDTSLKNTINLNVHKGIYKFEIQYYNIKNTLITYTENINILSNGDTTIILDPLKIDNHNNNNYSNSTPVKTYIPQNLSVYNDIIEFKGEEANTNDINLKFDYLLYKYNNKKYEFYRLISKPPQNKLITFDNLQDGRYKIELIYYYDTIKYHYGITHYGINVKDYWKNITITQDRFNNILWNGFQLVTNFLSNNSYDNISIPIANNSVNHKFTLYEESYNKQISKLTSDDFSIKPMHYSNNYRIKYEINDNSKWINVGYSNFFRYSDPKIPSLLIKYRVQKELNTWENLKSPLTTTLYRNQKIYEITPQLSNQNRIMTVSPNYWYRQEIPNFKIDEYDIIVYMTTNRPSNFITYILNNDDYRLYIKKTGDRLELFTDFKNYRRTWTAYMRSGTLFISKINLEYVKYKVRLDSRGKSKLSIHYKLKNNSTEVTTFENKTFTSLTDFNKIGFNDSSTVINQRIEFYYYKKINQPKIITNGENRYDNIFQGKYIIDTTIDNFILTRQKFSSTKSIIESPINIDLIPIFDYNINNISQNKKGFINLGVVNDTKYSWILSQKQLGKYIVLGNVIPKKTQNNSYFFENLKEGEDYSISVYYRINNDNNIFLFKKDSIILIDQREKYSLKVYYNNLKNTTWLKEEILEKDYDLKIIDKTTNDTINKINDESFFRLDWNKKYKITVTKNSWYKNTLTYLVSDNYQPMQNKSINKEIIFNPESDLRVRLLYYFREGNISNLNPLYDGNENYNNDDLQFINDTNGNTLNLIKNNKILNGISEGNGIWKFDDISFNNDNWELEINWKKDTTNKIGSGDIDFKTTIALNNVFDEFGSGSLKLYDPNNKIGNEIGNIKLKKSYSNWIFNAGDSRTNNSLIGQNIIAGQQIDWSSQNRKNGQQPIKYHIYGIDKNNNINLLLKTTQNTVNDYISQNANNYPPLKNLNAKYDSIIIRPFYKVLYADLWQDLGYTNTIIYNVSYSISFQIRSMSFVDDSTVNYTRYLSEKDVSVKIYNLGSFDWWKSDEGYNTYISKYKIKNGNITNITPRNLWNSKNVDEIKSILSNQLTIGTDNPEYQINQADIDAIYKDKEKLIGEFISDNKGKIKLSTVAKKIKIELIKNNFYTSKKIKIIDNFAITRNFIEYEDEIKIQSIGDNALNNRDIITTNSYHNLIKDDIIVIKNIENNETTTTRSKNSYFNSEFKVIEIISKTQFKIQHKIPMNKVKNENIYQKGSTGFFKKKYEIYDIDFQPNFDNLFSFSRNVNNSNTLYRNLNKTRNIVLKDQEIYFNSIMWKNISTNKTSYRLLNSKNQIILKDTDSISPTNDTTPTFVKDIEINNNKWNIIKNLNSDTYTILVLTTVNISGVGIRTYSNRTNNLTISKMNWNSKIVFDDNGIEKPLKNANIEIEITDNYYNTTNKKNEKTNYIYNTNNDGIFTSNLTPKYYKDGENPSTNKITIDTNNNWLNIEGKKRRSYNEQILKTYINSSSLLKIIHNRFITVKTIVKCDIGNNNYESQLVDFSCFYIQFDTNNFKLETNSVNIENNFQLLNKNIILKIELNKDKDQNNLFINPPYSKTINLFNDWDKNTNEITYQITTQPYFQYWKRNNGKKMVSDINIKSLPNSDYFTFEGERKTSFGTIWDSWILEKVEYILYFKQGNTWIIYKNSVLKQGNIVEEDYIITLTKTNVKSDIPIIRFTNLLNGKYKVKAFYFMKTKKDILYNTTPLKINNKIMNKDTNISFNMGFSDEIDIACNNCNYKGKIIYKKNRNEYSALNNYQIQIEEHVFKNDIDMNNTTLNTLYDIVTNNTVTQVVKKIINNAGNKFVLNIINDVFSLRIPYNNKKSLYKITININSGNKFNWNNQKKYVFLKQLLSPTDLATDNKTIIDYLGQNVISDIILKPNLLSINNYKHYLPNWSIEKSRAGPFNYVDNRNTIKNEYYDITWETMNKNKMNTSFIKTIEYYLLYNEPQFFSSQNAPSTISSPFFYETSFSFNKNKLTVKFKHKYIISSSKTLQLRLPGYYSESDIINGLNIDFGDNNNIKYVNNYFINPISNDFEPIINKNLTQWNNKTKRIIFKLNDNIKKDILYEFDIVLLKIKKPINLKNDKNFDSFIQKKLQTNENLINSFLFLPDDFYNIQAIYTTNNNLQIYSYPSKPIEINFKKNNYINLDKIKGNIFTKNYSGNPTNPESNDKINLANVTLVISNNIDDNNRKHSNTILKTDNDGMFYSRIKPGTYDINLTLDKTNPEHSVFDDNYTRTFTLEKGEIQIKDNFLKLSPSIKSWNNGPIDLESSTDVLKWKRGDSKAFSATAKYETIKYIFEKNISQTTVPFWKIIKNPANPNHDPIVIDDKNIGYLNLDEGTYRLGAIYTFAKKTGQTKNFTIWSGWSKNIKITKILVKCNFYNLLVPDKLNIRYITKKKLNIEIPEKQIKDMYKGMKNLCKKKVNNPDGSSSWVVSDNLYSITDIYIIIKIPNKSDPIKKSIFDNDVNYEPLNSVWNEQKNPINVFTKDISFNNNGIQQIKENPIYKLKDVKSISLDYNMDISGTYKISWGYDFYHLSKKGFKYSIGLKQLIETGNDLPGSLIIPNLDWENNVYKQNTKTITRFLSFNYPKYYIPKSMLINYNYKTEILTTYVKKKEFNDLFESLVIANNNNLLNSYTITKINVVAFIPNKNNIDKNYIFNKDGSINEISNNIIKFDSQNFYSNDLYGFKDIVVNVYPPLPWTCNTNIRKYGEIVLKLPKPKEGKWNFIWNYDYSEVENNREEYYNLIENTDSNKQINFNEIKIINQREVDNNNVITKFIKPKLLDISFNEVAKKFNVQLHKKDLKLLNSLVYSKNLNLKLLEIYIVHKKKTYNDINLNDKITLLNLEKNYNKLQNSKYIQVFLDKLDDLGSQIIKINNTIENKEKDILKENVNISNFKTLLDNAITFNDRQRFKSSLEAASENKLNFENEVNLLEKNRSEITNDIDSLDLSYNIWLSNRNFYKNINKNIDISINKIETDISNIINNNKTISNIKSHWTINDFNKYKCNINFDNKIIKDVTKSIPIDINDGFYEFVWLYKYNNVLYSNYDMFGFPDNLNILERHEVPISKTVFDNYMNIGLNYYNRSPKLYKGNLVLEDFLLPNKFSIKFIYKPTVENTVNNILRITHYKSLTGNLTIKGQQLLSLDKNKGKNNELILQLKYNDKAFTTVYNKLNYEFDEDLEYDIQIDIININNGEDHIFFYVDCDLKQKINISTKIDIVNKYPCYLFLSDILSSADCEISNFSLDENYGIQYNNFDLERRILGNFNLYNPENIIDVNKTIYNKQTNEIHLYLHQSVINNIKNSILNISNIKNIDDNGISLDFIVYWWKPNDNLPIITDNLLDLSKKIYTNQINVKTKKRYPNNFKFKNNNINDVIPNNLIKININDNIFGEYNLFVSYRLKANLRIKNVDIMSNFKETIFFTPQLNGWFNNNFNNLINNIKSLNVDRNINDFLKQLNILTIERNNSYILEIPNDQLLYLKNNLKRKNIKNGVITIYIFEENFDISNYDENTFKNNIIKQESNNQIILNNNIICKTYSYTLNKNYNKNTWTIEFDNDNFPNNLKLNLIPESFKDIQILWSFKYRSKIDNKEEIVYKKLQSNKDNYFIKMNINLKLPEYIIPKKPILIYRTKNTFQHEFEFDEFNKIMDVIEKNINNLSKTFNVNLNFNIYKIKITDINNINKDISDNNFDKYSLLDEDKKYSTNIVLNKEKRLELYESLSTTIDIETIVDTEYKLYSGKNKDGVYIDLFNIANTSVIDDSTIEYKNNLKIIKNNIVKSLRGKFVLYKNFTLNDDNNYFNNSVRFPGQMIIKNILSEKKYNKIKNINFKNYNKIFLPYENNNKIGKNNSIFSIIDIGDYIPEFPLTNKLYGEFDYKDDNIFLHLSISFYDYVNLTNNLFKNFGLHKETNDLFGDLTINQGEDEYDHYYKFLLKEKIKITFYLYDASLKFDKQIHEIVNLNSGKVFKKEVFVKDILNKKVIDTYLNTKDNFLFHKFIFDLTKVENYSNWECFWTYTIIPDIKYNLNIKDINGNFYPKTPPLNTMIFNKNKINNINLKIEPRVNVFTKISKSELPNIERNDEIIDPYCRRKCKDSQPINKNNSSSYSSKSQYSLAVNNNSRRITIPNVNYDGYRKKYMKK